jgi:hypothetical protein
MLAGVCVSRNLVRQLADVIDEPTAGTFEACLDAGRAVISLSIEGRERILRVLEDCPDGLAELRGVLLCEHEWRRREGL